MKSTVLLLSTYPFSEPQHGGQVRLANIAKAYQEAGWEVASVAVYDPEAYIGVENKRGAVPFPVTSPYRLFGDRPVPLINDLLAGQFAVAENGGYPEVSRQLPPRIDAIHVEQPWLWPLATKLVPQRSGLKPVLVLGSQNIEAPLKQELMESFGVAGINDVFVVIDALERQAAAEADLTLAVTRADMEILRQYGARNLLLAPNGIAPWSASEEVLARWRESLPKAPWMLYVASAHPPNFTHFTEVVGDTLACIPPDSRLVVAGGVTEHIYRVLEQSPWRDVNLSRLQLLGILPEVDLAAVKTLAHAFLLPIPHGGGSNIKTAEAIYSGAYVLGTPMAFRGFEDFVNLPEVSVAKTSREMQDAIRCTLQRSPAPAGGREAIAKRAELRWDRCLAALPQAVSEIIAARQSL